MALNSVTLVLPYLAWLQSYDGNRTLQF